MSKIEQVARAMWEIRRAKAGLVFVELEEWGDGSIPKANHIMEEARAAVEAMREPTKEMVAAGHRHDPLACDVGEDQIEYCYGGIWRAMIDAAL